jgi:hypothetical protein
VGAVPAAEASRSRKLVARSRRRLLGGATNEEEARANLQTRLNVYSKLMFWSFVALLVFLGGTYTHYDLDHQIGPQATRFVFGGGTILLAVMALIWRLVVVRRKLSVDGLYRIDLTYAITIGCAFAASAVLQEKLEVAGYASLIYSGFTVSTRALLVPSTGRRTAIVSSMTFVPLIAAAIYLAVAVEHELPRPAYVCGGLLICAVQVLIATTGSRIIYGLRQQVEEAKQAVQLGQYTLDRKIGEGGMGSVHRAHHALLRRPTAIKLLHPDRVGAESLERFEREVQLMSQLTHPNTVAVYDYGHNPDGVFYYAMEYLGGIDLAHLVKRFGPQRSGRVVDILRQVCGALQEAHDANFIHRDIKPANIILCERGGIPDFAKVVDFGLVNEITQGTGASTQVILGTPAYLAPEAVTGKVGPAFDLYALGAVGYFLLTGRQVFEGKTALEVCLMHVTHTPAPLSEVASQLVSPALEAIIMKCLAKAPADRYASATALAEALEALGKARDWDVDDARAWWRDFRAEDAAPPQSETPTMTITVDLQKRSA